MPSTLKFTPLGRSIPWGRTEFSANVDALVEENGAVHGTDRVTLAATSVLVDGEHFNFAVAPVLVRTVRGERSTHVGGNAITRFDWGRNSAGATLSWTGGAGGGTWDVGAGFGHRIGATKFTPHVNALWEKTAGLERQWGLFEGVEYQINDRFALDVAGQHYRGGGVAPDHHLVFGLTVNFGHLMK